MTIIKRTAFLFCLIILGATTISAQEISIIPKPQEIHKKSGQFVINEKTHIHLEGVSKADISLFAEQLKEATSFDLPFSGDGDKNALIFHIDPSLELPNDEGYILNISKDGVKAKAKNTKGIFYATQSLRQLLPLAIDDPNNDKTNQWRLPAVRIKDYPRYDWRGYM